jgi:hypothetical protein
MHDDEQKLDKDGNQLGLPDPANPKADLVPVSPEIICNGYYGRWIRA